MLTKRLLGRYLLSRLDAVVFSSDLEREDCYFAIEKERAYVIHHPVMRDDAVAPVPKATDPQCVVFGYFGRFHAKKNIHLVVQALLGLSDRVRLHIAGSGELKITLRELAAQLGVDDRIRWWGFVNIAERNAYFSSCDVLVMPSAYECFGMAHAESICCERASDNDFGDRHLFGCCGLWMRLPGGAERGGSHGGYAAV